MNEIVKYNNEFNKIKLPSFTELEQNLLFAIISKIKEQEKVYFNHREIFSSLDLNYRISDTERVKLLESLKNKFFKADFTIIRKEKILYKEQEKEVIANRTFNLFKEFAIYYDKDQSDPSPEPLIERFYGIELVVNEKFAYLLKELTSNFTRFELAEFIALSGKYTKTLYRLLKQYRNTGHLKMEWSEFLRVMDIPSSYQMCDIEKQILKPAIKELTAERNLFDQKRIPFKNLSYNKIKGKGRGRGGNVIGIEFYFNPQYKELAELESNYELEEYRYKTCKIKGKKNTYTIGLITQFNQKINVIFDNDTENSFSVMYSSIDDFKSKVKIL